MSCFKDTSSFNTSVHLSIVYKKYDFPANTKKDFNLKYYLHCFSVIICALNIKCRNFFIIGLILSFKLLMWRIR